MGCLYCSPLIYLSFLIFSFITTENHKLSANKIVIIDNIIFTTFIRSILLLNSNFSLYTTEIYWFSSAIIAFLILTLSIKPNPHTKQPHMIVIII